ncbi:general L-amino acid transport system permease protein [Loktanella ponticola]|uniref:General L-amino acid transport system permease protein n=1 Tax=Yoonia ponticola TaxID=1524255 RepID=A0A7W9EWM7_9RHOB|nr:amino acid ABC transporter permease [Yoonia ponticola]MBB5720774.1 general L-amino acid transport system permease protein [Yoonia ponticola]
MSDTHAQTVSYVRDTMLPETSPPSSQVGAVRWLRENLFSSVTNALLTLISIYVVYYVISHIGPWMVGGIWDAGSLAECREIRNATLGTDASVACWAVLGDRWHQLLFGFYPSDLYWRPILALIVFGGGIAPIMFDKVPRKTLILSALAPFVCFWLLWGGSIWLPISAALGFVVGYIAYGLISKSLGSLAGMIAAIVLPLIYWLMISGPLYGALHNAAPIGIEFVESRAFGGFMLSVVIGLSAIVLSLPLGILLALARQSDLFIIKTSAVVFIEVIRGVPLIVWLFTAQLLLNYFLPPGTNFDLTLRVIIMVTLFASAYIAEVVRGGLAALPKGQYEGADSLGLSYWQSMQLIVLPQALKISIPGIVNTFIGLFKDTTLVVFIGLADPIGFSNLIRASTDWNGIYWELFIFIGAMFFLFCFSMGRYSLYLENKLQRENR